MYSDRINALIDMALIDGEITEAEKQVLLKRAMEEGIDLAEFEMILNAKIYEMKLKRNNTPQPSQSNKYGDIKKCPACGAIVASYQGRCDECGHEFENIKANSTATQLADKLLCESDIRRKIEIIETFPIPITKADLIELLTSLKPRIMGEYNQMTDAYLKKYQECIEKSKVAFAGDKQLAPFIADLPQIEQRVKALKSQSAMLRAVKWAKEHWVATLILLFVIASCIFSAIQAASDSDVKGVESKIQQMINNNQLDEAAHMLQTADVNKYRLAGQLIEKYVANDDVEKAIHVYENITPGHCKMDELGYDHLTHQNYEPRATKLIYEKLIAKEMFNQAWEYHPLNYDERDSYMNADCYYQYMVDVIMHLCKNNRAAEARKFVTENAVWFDKYVTNGDYTYDKAKARLLRIISQQ